MSLECPNVYDAEKVGEIRDWVAGCGHISEALDILQRRLRLSRDHCQRLNRTYGFWGKQLQARTAPKRSSLFDDEEPVKAADPSVSTPEPPPSRAGAHMSVTGDVAEADLVDTSPRTLDELLAACKVDLETWEVERYVVNKWEMGRKDKRVDLSWTDGRPSGSVNDTGGITKCPLWQVKAWLRRKVEKTALKAVLDEFTRNAAAHAPRRWVYEKGAVKGRDCLYVLNLQDSHLAKLAWGRETGGPDYDIKLAEEAYRNAVDDLILKAPVARIDQVILIVGSDLLQVDNDRSATTAGTYVDSDSRLAKAFEVAARMLTDVVEKLANQFKVKCVVVPGNHDSTVSMFLGHYVAAWFRSHPNVEVDNDPKSRKYHGFGKTLIGFDHGDETKLADLPLILMRENQATVSRYRFQEVLTGHTHHEGVNEYKGVKVRVAPALCPADRWHARRGLVGCIRQSQGLLYQRDHGLEAIYYSTPLD